MKVGELPSPIHGYPDLHNFFRCTPNDVDVPLFRDRYRVTSMLGRGGMGFVFAAIDTHETDPNRRQVAIKAILRLPGTVGWDPARLRFQVEMRAGQDLGAGVSPRLVRVYDQGRDDSYPDQGYIIVMELLHGCTLAAATQLKKSLGQEWSVEEVQQIGCQVAAAMAAAHDLDWLHRDIKPNNIWLRTSAPLERGELPAVLDAVVLDFGLARDVSLGGEGPTQPGSGFGTPCYSPAEQLRGSVTDKRWLDVHALGVVLAELLFGAAALFDADVRYYVRNVSPADIPPTNARPVPPWLTGLVRKMLTHEPALLMSQVHNVLDNHIPRQPASDTDMKQRLSEDKWNSLAELSRQGVTSAVRHRDTLEPHLKNHPALEVVLGQYQLLQLAAFLQEVVSGFASALGEVAVHTREYINEPRTRPGVLPWSVWPNLWRREKGMSAAEQVNDIRKRVDLQNVQFAAAVKPWRSHCRAYPALLSAQRKTDAVAETLPVQLKKLEKGSDANDPVTCALEVVRWATSELTQIAAELTALRDEAGEALDITLARTTRIRFA